METEAISACRPISPTCCAQVKFWTCSVTLSCLEYHNFTVIKARNMSGNVHVILINFLHFTLLLLVILQRICISRSTLKNVAFSSFSSLFPELKSPIKVIWFGAPGLIHDILMLSLLGIIISLSICTSIKANSTGTTAKIAATSQKHSWLWERTDYWKFAHQTVWRQKNAEVRVARMIIHKCFIISWRKWELNPIVTFIDCGGLVVDDVQFNLVFIQPYTSP